ncbi:exopolysaccharide biosynthesis polyprenyl glycosylphosphotransferase [Flavobacteriaceae bacterium TP-CH-4]|uniref:Exopolysaccharide biosynthesis polyprenyl glycosylphosphotransferase n=1 Tax=Pelagihabitans pacificus TaxID=2696054 RepID=A0A967B1H2_9FLAO|nr:exopolysaccharide biosynthesis polyprenyl glycosylphosphotransferase [Pelagihabitans pacificus]NHF61377.1 exopolysaccharide biosynthesis polyprenyl glycosylphosphotransferase [Pelagihabitans pacificus]
MKRFRNSDLIIPISILVHLGIINGVLYLLTPETYLNGSRILFYNLSWLLTTYFTNYYPTARKEKFITNIHKVFQIYLIFGLSYFAVFGISGRLYESLEYQFFVLLLIFLCLFWYRVLFFWIRGKYRKRGGNFVNVVVVGRDPSLKKIRKVFDEPGLGYRYKGYFDDRPSKSPTYLGPVIDCFKYILENNVNEIYCVASKFNSPELKNLINFADNNLLRFKVILDNKDIFSRAMSIESYEKIPVLNLRKVPLDTEYARIIKRTFDIVFSSLVIVFVLSWLTPILFALIKLESPGKLYFKQKRHGLKRKTFWCYKFRSMTTNTDANNKMATKNDARVTKIGKFLRKTSIDELPQFFNVFMGDMSVIGPRPHMELHTWNYETSVDKYLVRHFVKPGITGLAQIKGYRGEIVKPADILNRTRLDIFYVEKWNLALDFYILFLTVFNVVRGEAKAY